MLPQNSDSPPQKMNSKAEFWGGLTGVCGRVGKGKPSFSANINRPLSNE